MLVTNMSRLPLAALDFGAGAPADFKSLGQLESVVSVLPAKSGVNLGVFAPVSAPAAAAERSRAQPRARAGRSH